MKCDVCDADAQFTMTERWSTEPGMSTTLDMWFCGECVKDASPAHSDNAYARYEFSIKPTPEEFGMTELEGNDR
jgi:hypothetical protein